MSSREILYIFLKHPFFRVLLKDASEFCVSKKQYWFSIKIHFSNKLKRLLYTFERTPVFYYSKRTRGRLCYVLVCILKTKAWCLLMSSKFENDAINFFCLGEIIWKVSRSHNLLREKVKSCLKLRSCLASLAKWLSVGLRTEWLWVRVPLQSLKKLF